VPDLSQKSYDLKQQTINKMNKVTVGLDKTHESSTISTMFSKTLNVTKTS